MFPVGTEDIECSTPSLGEQRRLQYKALDYSGLCQEAASPSSGNGMSYALTKIHGKYRFMEMACLCAFSLREGPKRSDTYTGMSLCRGKQVTQEKERNKEGR